MAEKNMIGEEIRKIQIYPIVTCGLDSSVTEIARKLRANKERRIFVVDAKGKLAGIITTTDLVYKEIRDGDKVNQLKAKEVMIGKVKSVDISEDLDRALGIMNELKTFNCPVTDKGKIVGIISYHDLVNYVFKSLEK